MAAPVAQPEHVLVGPTIGHPSGTPHEALDVLRRVFEVQGVLSAVIGVESRPFGLTASEAVALTALARESLPVSGIARTVGIRPNGASVLVDRLRERRLVRRQRSRRDNRVVTVELTDEGRQLIAALGDKIGPRLQSMLSALQPDELSELASSLAKLSG